MNYERIEAESELFDKLIEEFNGNEFTEEQIDNASEEEQEIMQMIEFEYNK